jgi:2-keto-3-deoxy-L-fuconate dehydrogenase
MPCTLTGKTALITAAGQGIGRAIAELFISEGAHVVATDRNPSALQGLACAQAPLDVCDQSAINDTIRSMAKLDILINCAGLVATGTILDTDDTAWDISHQVNLRSMFWTIKAALPRMLAQGGGSIVNIASVVSSLKAAPNRFAYATTKAGVIGLTKAVAIDFIGKGIRVNAICPGTIDTPSLHDRMTSPEARSAFIARQPIGRLGRVQEIAGIALYLASDAGSFATGSTFVVDGGMSL